MTVRSLTMVPLRWILCMLHHYKALIASRATVLTVPSHLKLVQLVKATSKITQSSNSETCVWPLNFEVFFLIPVLTGKAWCQDLHHSLATDAVFLMAAIKQIWYVVIVNSDMDRHDKGTTFLQILWRKILGIKTSYLFTKLIWMVLDTIFSIELIVNIYICAHGLCVCGCVCGHARLWMNISSL